jgi:TonB family protein
LGRPPFWEISNLVSHVLNKDIFAWSSYGFRRIAVPLCLGLLLASAPLCSAQDSEKSVDASKTDDGNKTGRKLVKKVDPVYPRDLRNRNIGGRVKLNVKIGASGTVETVAIVGGNPILADSAAHAVKQWQYAPSGSPTTVLLSVDFDPSR